ncbi:MAG: cytochrome ubiquinol oxidase subunit I [Bacteroidaceae bacterium]|nr:cytochrome ubiquinol oxidase subunit I [Bacteroidaceae bacterium]
MMNFLSIDMVATDWARAQFALTATKHRFFVPLTLVTNYYKRK